MRGGCAAALPQELAAAAAPVHGRQAPQILCPPLSHMIACPAPTTLSLSPACIRRALNSGAQGRTQEWSRGRENEGMVERSCSSARKGSCSWTRRGGDTFLAHVQSRLGWLCVTGAVACANRRATSMLLLPLDVGGQRRGGQGLLASVLASVGRNRRRRRERNYLLFRPAEATQ